MSRRRLLSVLAAFTLAVTFSIVPPAFADGPSAPVADAFGVFLSWINDLGESIGLAKSAEVAAEDAPGVADEPVDPGAPMPDGATQTDSEEDPGSEYGAVIDPQG